MPNWTTNYVTIEGEARALDQLKLQLATKHNPFDFNKLVPMPEELAQTVSPVTVVETEDEAKAINAACRRSSFHSEQTKAITRRERGRRIAAYGAVDWYDWAQKHWGTKWNACDVEVLDESATHVNYRFDTAWCAPTPLAAKLQALCASFSLSLSWDAQDEDGDGSYKVVPTEDGEAAT